MTTVQSLRLRQASYDFNIRGLKPGEVGEKQPEMVNEVVGWLKKSMVSICFIKHRRISECTGRKSAYIEEEDIRVNVP